MLTDKQGIFAEVFHTVLRKCLDSHASSICWNAVYILEDDAWEHFVQEMSEAEQINRDTCDKAMQWGRVDRNLFKLGLELLTDEEYEVIDQRVKEWME